MASSATATAAAKDATPAKPVAGGPQLKLLVDKRSRRVLYAEARKDAVDFLIGLLRVPVGLAARALAAHGEPAPGSLGTLYAGARALDDAFFTSAPSPPDRDALLSPALPSAALAPLLGGEGALPPPPPPPPPRRYFRCSAYSVPCRGNPMNVTDVSGVLCPACRQPMTVEMRWAPGGGDAHGSGRLAQEARPGEGGGGYVKEVVTYLVMDDLTVVPMSTISAIMLLKKFNVKDCSALEEMTVEVGTKQAVMLLKAALQSSTVLTDVFSGGVSIDTIDG
ncbi:hypothetical protein HU200_010410 [Digitaria exilis]|uniref:Uncharacterized protein n=1 Tax=Digitaria exilis TaxID=1010633 RepID=A0A835FJY1_9POAL|nr:hypothetical protein HU200_010410 [Digitaria exilis]